MGKWGRIAAAGAAGVVSIACTGDDAAAPGLDAGGFDVTSSDVAQPWIDASGGHDAGEDATITDAGTDAIEAADTADAADALACTITTDAGSIPGTLCSGTCVDLTSDPSHCGGCATSCEAGASCASSACMDVAGSLEGLEWYVPCTNAASPACSATDPPVVQATLNGAQGITYDVTLRFRGVVEQKTCTPNPVDAGAGDAGDGGDAGPTGPVATGTNAALFSTTVTPVNDSYNVYSLAISAPAQTAYLNVGTSNIQYCFLLDYVVTLPMQAGATVSLTAMTIDGAEIINRDQNGTPIAVPGITFDGGATFDGQFIRMDVLGVAPR